MGFPKDFDFASCLHVTLVLKDFQVLTGRFKGLIGDRAEHDCCDKDHEHEHEHKHEDEKCKKDDKCCKSPKLDIDVKVEDDCEFILLELTRTAAAINLSSFTCNIHDDYIKDIDFVVSGTTFPVGTCVAINVCNILYAGPCAVFCDIPFHIGRHVTGDGLTISLKE
ncbi:MAG: hypothetical protein H6Q69_2749 [Firmicutes bacterium]|nr:hypothetical protein [Bacillota bacterium]